MYLLPTVFPGGRTEWRKVVIGCSCRQSFNAKLAELLIFPLSLLPGNNAVDGKILKDAEILKRCTLWAH